MNNSDSRQRDNAEKKKDFDSRQKSNFELNNHLYCLIQKHIRTNLEDYKAHRIYYKNHWITKQEAERMLNYLEKQDS